MADGICALGRSVRTVGCFTDGHGRDAVTACSLGGNAGDGGFQVVPPLHGDSIDAYPTILFAGLRSAGGLERDRPADRESVKIARRDRTTEARVVGKSLPPASCPATCARPSMPPSALADLRARPAPCCDLRCTLCVPRSYLSRAGSRRTWPQPGPEQHRHRRAGPGFRPRLLYALRSAVAAHASAAGLSRQQVYNVVSAAHELAANAVSRGAGTLSQPGSSSQ
jgi:hypothetical protein